MKQVNFQEIRNDIDELASVKLSLQLKSLGLNAYQDKCCVTTPYCRQLDEMWSDALSDTHMILCYRPTLAFVQHWLYAAVGVYVSIQMNASPSKWFYYTIHSTDEDNIVKDTDFGTLYMTHNLALENGLLKVVTELNKQRNEQSK